MSNSRTTTQQRLLLIAWAFAFACISCSRKSQPTSPAPTPQPAPAASTNAPPAAPPAAEPTPAAHGVSTEMRNVLFHLTPTAAAHLIILSGEIWPTGKNDMVSFDDKTSFEVRVTNGTVAISPAALSDVMNNYVFARKDAPLKNISVSIDNAQLIIKGKLHDKKDIPFATAGTLSVNPDGRLRVHTTKITALHVPVKGVMGIFGIELAHVLNTSKTPGIDTDKDDLLMDLGTLLPPPHIGGKVAAVRVEKNAIVTVFGDGGKSLAPKEPGSYMVLEGNPVKFGKLVMDPADLTVLDMDAGGTLEWDQDHYRQQLEAGYSKITPNFGLRAYAKDYSKLSRSAPPSASPPGPSASPSH
jgi:hypothetical protein